MTWKGVLCSPQKLASLSGHRKQLLDWWCYHTLLSVVRIYFLVTVKFSMGIRSYVCSVNSGLGHVNICIIDSFVGVNDLPVFIFQK